MLSERRPPTANSRISAFLESQRGFMSYYAAEGKTVAASWLKQSSGDSCPASPILVPRAAAAKDDGLRTMEQSVSPGKPVPTFPINKNGAPISESQKPRAANSSKPTRVVPSQLSTSRRKSTDRNQCSDDEPERLQRLEQRRNRRRARRHAMGVVEGATDRGDNASEKDVSRKTNNRQKLQSRDKMDRKKAKAKVTPALLLMQNFSSQSLGKSRLTIRPSPNVGVFNKGKNSGKITKSKRAERLVPDIVFSESRFLNKTPSAPNGNEDTEDDSDSSDDHSVHSSAERACRRKDRAINSQRSSSDVIVDQASRSGSPAPSSRSIREESPPWDIEETTRSPSSSTKSANHSTTPDRGHSPPPPAQKDITVNTERSVWASKLGNPRPHTDNTDSASRSHLPRVPPVQHRTTSTYFAPITAPREPNVSVAPSIELDKPEEEEQPSHRVDSCSTTAPDSINPLSTTEGLQLGHAHLLPAPESTYMRTKGTCLPSDEAPATRALSRATNPQGDRVQCDWEYDMESEPERKIQNYFTPGHTKRVDWTNEHIWNDSDIPGWEEYSRPSNLFPTEEVQFHEVHSDLEYDIPFEDRVGYSNGEAEYLYEESEHIYEDDEYLDKNTDGYTHYPGDGDLEYEDIEEDTFLEELDDYSPHLEAMQEPESYQSVEWSTIDDTTEDFGIGQIDLEINDTMAQDESMETEEWAEQTPRLIRVITEASLQDDLVKSMSGHWSVAHRLY